MWPQSHTALQGLYSDQSVTGLHRDQSVGHARGEEETLLSEITLRWHCSRGLTTVFKEQQMGPGWCWRPLAYIHK
ncbi:hypothetical protein MHYP_G00236850 [Metynnis hypsauchen]